VALVDVRALSALKAKLLKRKLALSHEEDADGIVSAALYLMVYPDAVLVLARPQEVRRTSLNWLNLFTWDYVADLPCPRKAKLRVDHHVTNEPCAEVEFYDPGAPCAAALALEALGLKGNPRAELLVELARQTDTASIVDQRAWDLNDAVKGADYGGRLYLAVELARRGLEVLDEERVRKWILKNRARRARTERIADAIGASEIVLVEFSRDLDISYRGLCTILERRGAKFIALVVPREGAYRVYLAASRDSDYDVSAIAAKLGGGGHRRAAGARFAELAELYDEVKRYLGLKELEILVISDGEMARKKL